MIPPETHTRPASGQAARSLHFGAFDPLGAFVRRGLERAVLADRALAGVPDAARWAAEVREQAWSVYRSHETGYDAAGRAHLRTAAHVLATYRALAALVDSGSAIDLLGRALTDAYRPLFRRPVPLVLRLLRRPLRTIARLGGSRFLQRRLFGAGFAIGAFDEGGVVELRVDRCLYHGFFATCGTPELTAVICRSDAAWADALPSTGAEVGFERPRTLGWGGAQCVFRFTARPAEQVDRHR